MSSENPATTSAAAGSEPLPAFEPTNVVDLVSIHDSEITNVSLYPGRAEITRSYKFTVKTGQNQVNINGLPIAMDQESLRVEGRGSATIHDVTLSYIPEPEVASTSARLEDLISEKDLSERALQRCRKGLASLEAYVSSLHVQHTGVRELDGVIDHYDQTAEKLDKKVISLEKAIKKLDEDIQKERKELTGPPRDEKLRLRAAIGVFAAVEGQVEIALIYGVEKATWTPLYDIRVDMQAKEKPAKVIYKAAITQDTGEAWEDVPLSLETVSPTFGLGLPTLFQWNLSLYKPEPKMTKSRGSYGGSFRRAARPMSLAAPVERFSSADSMMIGFKAATMEHRSLHVDPATKSGVNATFRVPGTITVPTDGTAHNVTVAQLELDAAMSWISIPKIDSKTHLKAKIKNASEYTLLAGSASVYVDGSFISRSKVPLVSPQESFDCPLGLDQSVRVVYHPLSKKVSQSGFYTRHTNHLFTQRITIHNTKSVELADFKIVDQVPVSEDAQVTVKLISPALALPFADSASAAKEGENSNRTLPSVAVGEGIVAQWEADEPGLDVEALGKDGKLSWVCTVPSQGKVNLILSWEVVAPLRSTVTGL